MKSTLKKAVVIVAYLVERSVVGEDDWVLTGSGFYNPSIEGSAEHCVEKWNEAATDPFVGANTKTVATRYEYRVKKYRRLID